MIAWMPPLVSVMLATSCTVTTTGVSSIAAPAREPAALSPKDFEVLPASLAWEGLSPQVFDRAWILPDPRKAPGRDLLVEMRNLLGLRFEYESPDGTLYRCFGDLVAATQAMEPDERQAWYAGLERLAPGLIADWGAGISKLLLDAHLHSSRWSPAKDDARDGILLAEGWDMKSEGNAPWTQIKVRPLMEQGAALLGADLAAIKAIENDYRTYPDNVGADYEEIGPLDGSYYVGEDRAGRPFSTLTIQFRCDLPFPFSDYTTRLGILNHFDDADVLRTDIYSTSKDFYWLAGRDVFLPVTTSQGEWVAFLLVRHFGFDLDGVPDGPDARRQALRASMGNLKRNAERLFAERRKVFDTPQNSQASLGKVRVFGRR